MNVKLPDSFVGKPGNYPESNLPRSEVKKRFAELLGPFEKASCPLNIRVTEEIELPGEIIRQRLEYDVEPWERVPAFHLFKKGLAAAAPGILAIHAHGGAENFPLGKSVVCLPEPGNPNQYAYHAALAGFRVLAPDALCFGERQSKWGYGTALMDEIISHAELCSRGKSFTWKSVWDNSRAVEVLRSMGAQRIGTMGHSGGSTQSYILAAANENIAAAACFASFCTLRHQFYQYRLSHCLYHYIPGMLSAGIDWDQVASLIAPRKVFLGRGAKDEGTPGPMFTAFCEAIRKADEKALVAFEDAEHGHEMTMPILEAALEFFKRSL